MHTHTQHRKAKQSNGKQKQETQIYKSKPKQQTTVIKPIQTHLQHTKAKAKGEQIVQHVFPVISCIALCYI
jgi:alpha-L-arabinofuranosidase